jgi:hypothetical protein
MNIINSFQSEWLKTKRSAATWLVLIGGFFIPVILLIAQLINYKDLYAATTAAHFWDRHFSKAWQSMALFLLPMGVILAASLIAQIEYRNNTWKQLHTTPQGLTTIFFAKLTVILVMMIQFFMLFNIGIWLSGIIPSLMVKGVSYPTQPIPFVIFFKWEMKFFIDCLPIIGLQYLLSLQFKNFLVPIAAGLAFFVGSIIAISWKYAFIIPYTYCSLTFMNSQGRFSKSVSLHVLAVAWFILFIAAAYILYITKKQKG